MLALYAEIQVAGLAEPLATFDVCLDQPIDEKGRPSSTVRYRPIRATLVGLAAMVDFFTQWGADSYMRQSGWLVVYEADQVKWRLAFYDAWCVVYGVKFRPGVDGQAAYVVELALSAAWWALNGIDIEHHSALWWEKDRDVRKRALTPPPPIMPGPGARNRPAERQPTPAQTPPPTPALSAITGSPLSPKPPKTALDPRKKPLYAPTVSKWYKKGGSIEVLDNGNWKFTDWEHNSVVYEGEEPNFNRYARQQVDIEGMTGDCTTDFTKADNSAPLGPKKRGNTWHHQQNMRTMQEVPRDIHERFTHYGARYLLNKPTTKRVLRKK